LFRWADPPCKHHGAALFLSQVKQEPRTRITFIEGRCGQPETCPLSQVQAGAVVCIKELLTSPEVKERLREMGFCEEQRIRLLARDSNYICQVCNARLGISDKLADAIFVEPLTVSRV
jgi:Fe2+ transport system protein FeoA